MKRLAYRCMCLACYGCNKLEDRNFEGEYVCNFYRKAEGRQQKCEDSTEDKHSVVKTYQQMSF
jgi:hypothetical protein